MNKIFKVIWSKARNCYIVVSEYAKRFSKSSRRLAVSGIIAAMVMGSGMGTAYADVVKGITYDPETTILDIEHSASRHTYINLTVIAQEAAQAGVVISEGENITVNSTTDGDGNITYTIKCKRYNIQHH